MGLGKRESVADVARVLSRYNDLIIARLFDHSVLLELAEYASVPVINALTNHSHPCQVFADLYTMRQHGKLFEGVKVVFVGDGNNVVNSWLEMSMLYPMHFWPAVPPAYNPHVATLKAAMKAGVSKIEILEDPKQRCEMPMSFTRMYGQVWGKKMKRKNVARHFDRIK
ncbi:MAG: hypothetical protein RMI34_05515 [Chloroherpetonaceae bacterium]|nr:hypothetical protein [Chloroherpetonaceae bacterium]